MPFAAYDPRRWTTTGAWTDESYEGALARTPSFGQRFFSGLFVHHPDLRARVRFLRWSAQSNDVYAVIDWPGGGAGVQIDADLEYIIVWGVDGVPAEYGHLNEDPVQPALAHLLRMLSPGGAGC